MTEEMKKVLALVMEMEKEEKKTEYKYVPHYYKRNGKMIERSYPEIKYTERYKELFFGNSGIRGVKVFKCNECGEMVDYFDLETWCCDFMAEDGCICSDCYEWEMGEDL